MQGPSFSELPPPPDDRSGWPWRAAAAAEQSSLAAPRVWPRISIITPSYNQGRFLEQTLRSVLLQGYPDLEYIVIDGGSTDDSVGIIRRYDRWLTHWVSEKDRGQSHAINKGFAQATGQVLCWLNSDDYYLPGALHTVGSMLADETGHHALVGHCLRVHDDGEPPCLLHGHYPGRRRLLEFWDGYQMHQPSIFWRREVLRKVGWLDESLHLIMDFDYWVRIARHYEFVNLDRTLSCTNYHPAAKTGGDSYAGYYHTLRKYSRRYWGPLWSRERWELEAAMCEHFFAGPLRLKVYEQRKRLRRLGRRFRQWRED